MQKTWVQSLGGEDLLEEGMATLYSTLAWRIPMDRGAWWATAHGVTKSWTTEATSHTACTHTYTHTRAHMHQAHATVLPGSLRGPGLARPSPPAPLQSSVSPLQFRHAREVIVSAEKAGPFPEASTVAKPARLDKATKQIFTKQSSPREGDGPLCFLVG